MGVIDVGETATVHVGESEHQSGLWNVLDRRQALCMCRLFCNTKWTRCAFSDL